MLFRSGSTKTFENEIILNKIICGLAIESVVDTTLKLTKKETNEADNMLKAVIEYWKILKDTSINGLRETFLQRKAKMTIKQDESIELWVEQKGVDVLLTSIPWGIAMIKTPWMQFFIQCNWNL